MEAQFFIMRDIITAYAREQIAHNPKNVLFLYRILHGLLANRLWPEQTYTGIRDKYPVWDSRQTLVRMYNYAHTQNLSTKPSFCNKFSTHTKRKPDKASNKLSVFYVTITENEKPHIIRAVHGGNLQMVKHSLSISIGMSGYNPFFDNHCWPLRAAIIHGQLGIIKWMYDGLNSLYYNEYVIFNEAHISRAYLILAINACFAYGHLHVLKFFGIQRLMQVLADNGSSMIEVAIKNNHLNIVRWILHNLTLRHSRYTWYRGCHAPLTRSTSIQNGGSKWHQVVPPKRIETYKYNPQQLSKGVVQWDVIQFVTAPSCFILCMALKYGNIRIIKWALKRIFMHMRNTKDPVVVSRVKAEFMAVINAPEFEKTVVSAEKSDILDVLLASGIPADDIPIRKYDTLRAIKRKVLFYFK